MTWRQKMNRLEKRGIEFLKKQAKAIGEMGGGTLSGIIYRAWPATMPAGKMDKRPYMERSEVDHQGKDSAEII